MATDTPPLSPIEQSFLDRRPMTPAERLRMGDTLAVRWEVRKAYRKQREVADSARTVIRLTEEKLADETGQKTTWRSKAKIAKGENWGWRGLVLLLGVAFAASR